MIAKSPNQQMPCLSTNPPPYYRSSEERSRRTPIIINIRIDASINVNGDDNKIVTSSPSAASGSGDASSGTTTSRNPSQPNQSKLNELTTGIISALASSGVFEAEEDGSRYSVDLDIRTGVTVYGNKNVVCDGVPGKSGNKTTAQATKEKDQTELVVGRKRRAASEPVETPEAKRHNSK